MTRRSVRPRVDLRGSAIPARDPIARPAASGPVELGGISADPDTAVEMIGIGGHLAMSPLPHHRAYGSVPRRFGQLSGHALSR
jgi:hypothetical protein